MKRILAPGWNAVILNWRAFVAIQVVCVLMVVAYYALPSVQSACAVLARWKEEGGIAFAALSVAIAAVIIPEIVRRATRTPRDKPLTFGDVLFQFLYFAGLGIAIDILYKGLG